MRYWTIQGTTATFRSPMSIRDTLFSSELAAKRLRYTLEICQPVYQGRLDPFVKAVKQLQSLLGDIHDCDVWVADLDTFLEEERQHLGEWWYLQEYFCEFQDAQTAAFSYEMLQAAQIEEVEPWIL